jgi:hypothetical protein
MSKLVWRASGLTMLPPSLHPSAGNLKRIVWLRTFGRHRLAGLGIVDSDVTARDAVWCHIDEQVPALRIVEALEGLFAAFNLVRKRDSRNSYVSGVFA